MDTLTEAEKAQLCGIIRRAGFISPLEFMANCAAESYEDAVAESLAAFVNQLKNECLGASVGAGKVA